MLAVVQHHPARVHLLPELLERLSPLPTEVSAHSSEPPNPWEGYQVALGKGIAHPSKPTHLLVIQDDAVPCRNFAQAAEQIAEANPDCPVSLFIARLPAGTVKQVLQASRRRERYVDMRLRDFVPVIALLWPTHKAEEFLSWAVGRKLPGYPKPRSDDAVVGRWMMATRQRVRVTIPSLVEHPDIEPSLIGRRTAWGKDRGRVALDFIGEGDPLDYDWSSR